MIDQITLTSEGNCKTGPRDGSPTLTPATSPLKFTYDSLTTPLQVTCDKPVTVVRQSSLKSYIYEGTFEVLRGTTGRQVRVINVVPLDNYLRGVVPAEVPHTWPAETLKAQAVAARTYALYERAHHAANVGLPGDVDLDDTVYSQAYLGMSAVALSSDQAIVDTANEVIFYKNDVIAAFFSADSGGYTEDAENVFGPAAQAYCQGKPEAFPLSLEDPWTETYTQAKFMQKLAADGLAKASNPVTGVTIDPAGLFRSGRVNKLTLQLADGTSKEIAGKQLAAALDLRSDLYTVDVSAGPTFTINGRGFGHGVGMAQVGARILADTMGWTADQILTFYYTDVTLCHLGRDCP